MFVSFNCFKILHCLGYFVKEGKGVVVNLLMHCEAKVMFVI